MGVAAIEDLAQQEREMYELDNRKDQKTFVCCDQPFTLISHFHETAGDVLHTHLPYSSVDSIPKVSEGL
jgi:hypothetical protein